MKSWALLHQGGYVTYPHHDADGSNTFVRMHVGIKFWVMFRTKNKLLKRDKLRSTQMNLAGLPNANKGANEWEAEVVTLFPGDEL